MKYLSTLFVVAVLFSITSCNKWTKDKKNASYYYSTDYKLNEGVIMGVDIDDIDLLYTVFFYEKKTLKFKLVAEEITTDSEKEKGNVLAYTEGTAQVDKDLNILFVGETGTSSSFSGYFENEKKNHKATIPGLENRELNFILKK